MSLSHNGLFKLVEECGEVVQAVAKLFPYGPFPHERPRKALKTKVEHLEDEIGDLLAILHYVIAKLDLSSSKINKRIIMKTKRFENWAPPST